MHKSILILEESKMVHELFESALPQELWNWTINRESSPENYINKARETSPDIIFLSNQDQKRDYATVKELRSSTALSEVPILLLTSAKDKLDEKLLQSLDIRGFVRKPFESSTLQEQINIVLKEQENYQKHKPKDELKNINVVDDELLELLSGKPKSDMSIDELEGELDPTLRLVPNEMDIEQQNEDFDVEDDFEETELLEMDDSETIEEDPSFDFPDEDFDTEDDFEETELMEMEQSDFVDSDESYLENEELELIDVELEEIDSEVEFQDLSDASEFEEIGLEPQLDDLDDYSVFAPTSDPDEFQTGYQTIQVFDTYDPDFDTLLKNDPENKDDLGYMEIDIIPLRTTPAKSNVVESISDDFDEDEFIREHSPAELPSEFTSGDSDFELEDSSIIIDDEIEIPHEEIIEDFHLEPDDNTLDELENEGLLEISVEGMDEVIQSPDSAFEDKNQDNDAESIVEIDVQVVDEFDELEETTDDVSKNDYSVVEQDTIDSQDQNSEFLEQESSVDLELDFEEEPELTESDDENSLEELSLPGEMPDEFDLDSSDDETPDEFDLDSSEGDIKGSPASIQEMIGFRQVIKAKYDLTDKSEEVEDTDSDIELLFDEDAELPDDINLPSEEDDLSDTTDFTSEDIDKTDDDSMDNDLLAEVDDIDDDDLMNNELLAEVDDIVETDSMDDELLAEVNDMDDADSMDDEFLGEVDDIDETNSLDPELLAEGDDTDENNAIDDDLLSGEVDIDNDESTEDDIFDDVDDDLFTDNIEPESNEEIGTPSEIDLLSTEDIEDETDEDLYSLSDDFIDQDESLENIDLLSDNIDEDLTDTEPESGLEEDSLEETELFTSEQSEEETDDVQLLMEEDESLVDDIDFQPIEETDSTTEPESASAEDIAETSIDDIDFLPVDEDEVIEQEEAAASDSDIEQGTMDEIDFLPMGETQPEDEISDEEEQVRQDDDDEHDPSMNIVHAIEDEDEITIEVPHDTFEMADFNIDDITDDEQSEDIRESDNIPAPDKMDQSDINLMEGIDTVKTEDEEQESLDEITLPSMDEDLPDLPPILDMEEDSSLEDPDQTIQLVEDDDSFEDFPDESSVIGLTEPDTEQEKFTPGLTEGSGNTQGTQISPEFRNKLSAMIEGVISDTVKSTLHDMLPEMMDKIIHEELED